MAHKSTIIELQANNHPNKNIHSLKVEMCLKLFEHFFR